MSLDINDSNGRDERWRAMLGTPGERQPNGIYAPAKNVNDPALFEIINAAELLSNPAPPREWTCEPLFPRNEVTLFSGDGGIGKTTLMHQLAIAAALDSDWLGCSVRPGKTLVLSCEDGKDELNFRLRQIVGQVAKYSEADTLARLGNISIIDASRDIDPTLATYLTKDRGQKKVEPTEFYKQIKQEITKEGIDLFIIDSLADVFAEDIDRYAVRSFVRLLREIGCTVIIIAHPSIEGMNSGRGYSGSTHWNNSVRSRLYFKGPSRESQKGKSGDDAEDEQPDNANADVRILELPKANRGKSGLTIKLRWVNGCFVREDAAKNSIERELLVEAQFMLLLRKYEGRKCYLSPSPNSPQSYAPKVFAKHSEGKDYSKQEYARAMDRLFDAGKIETKEIGPPSNRRSVLATINGSDCFDELS